MKGPRTAMKSGPRTAMKSGPHLPQLEKALTRKKKKKKKYGWQISSWNAMVFLALSLETALLGPPRQSHGLRVPVLSSLPATWVPRICPCVLALAQGSWQRS